MKNIFTKILAALAVIAFGSTVGFGVSAALLRPNVPGGIVSPIDLSGLAMTMASLVVNTTTGLGTSAPSSTLHVVGDVQFSASSSVVTPSIGGSQIAAGTCLNATTSVDLSISSSSAAFVTTPRNYPGPGSTARSYLSSAGLITTEVCGLIVVNPSSTPYVVKIIK